MLGTIFLRITFVHRPQTKFVRSFRLFPYSRLKACSCFKEAQVISQPYRHMLDRRICLILEFVGVNQLIKHNPVLLPLLQECIVQLPRSYTSCLLARQRAVEVLAFNLLSASALYACERDLTYLINGTPCLSTPSCRKHLDRGAATLEDFLWHLYLLYLAIFTTTQPGCPHFVTGRPAPPFPLHLCTSPRHAHAHAVTP